MRQQSVFKCPDCGLPRVRYRLRGVWQWADCPTCRLFAGYDPDDDVDRVVATYLPAEER